MAFWYTNAILWAKSIEVVNGYSNTGMFGPGDNINREQIGCYDVSICEL